MDTLLQAIRSLGPMRLAVMGGVILGMIALFVYLTTRLAAPQLALLYGNLTQTDISSITQQLATQNIPYELRENGTAVYIPSGRINAVRMSVAQKGLPTSGYKGYAIFDKTSSLGTTNFMQNVNLVRAKEGELAMTIQTIDSVYSARVHLVTPKRKLFSRQRQEPSASIILKMRGGKRLTSEQVSAIQHLVAGAVPELSPKRISIVDGKGSLLARGFEDTDSAQARSVKAEHRRIAFEQRMARTIEELLEKSVGYGKVRAQVSADIDYNRVSTSEEVYDPDGQVVRSTQTIEEQASSRETEAEPVTVDANLPDYTADSGSGAGASQAESRTEETVNFEITKKVINHIREGGEIRRLSIAVLVDGKRWLNADTGQEEYADRTDEEMELLGSLVRGAVGFSADRGDTVEVINMEFADAELLPKKVAPLIMGLDKQDLMRMTEILVLSIVAILVVLLVIRPLVSRAFETLPSNDEAVSAEGRMLAAENAATPALTRPSGVAPPSEDLEEENIEELIDIDRVEGRVKASSVKKVGEIVEKHPAEAISIVRSWMRQEG